MTMRALSGWRRLGGGVSPRAHTTKALTYLRRHRASRIITSAIPTVTYNPIRRTLDGVAARTI